MKLFHNPRCRKSREAFELLQKKKVNFEIVEYLQTPPTEKELKSILKKLEISALDLIRKGETIYKENYKVKDLNQFC